MARDEIEALPWAIDDVRETHLYLLERDERLADEFRRRVAEALLALAEEVPSRDCVEPALAKWPPRPTVGRHRDAKRDA